jgi:hypothetical protein
LQALSTLTVSSLLPLSLSRPMIPPIISLLSIQEEFHLFTQLLWGP